MYNEQIENLINLALADGLLTEKEKQILFKKAEAAGIDLDEFEMVLDAKLFEKQQTINATPKNTAAPQSDKFGDVKKCPACGAIITSYSARCNDCGHEFANVKANATIHKLFMMLNDVRGSANSNAQQGFLNRLGQIVNDGLSGLNATSKKREIISNFPIPNTKADMLEFLALAIPKAKKRKLFDKFMSGSNSSDNEHELFADVWKAKCEQIILKAKFSMKDDKKTLQEIENYAQELK